MIINHCEKIFHNKGLIISFVLPALMWYWGLILNLSCNAVHY